MRKQYDEKLSENQLQKLLSNKHFNWNLDQLMSKRFRHSTKRLLMKNKSIKDLNENSQTQAKEEEEEQELSEAQAITRAFSLQIMPCLKHQQKRKSVPSLASQKEKEKSTSSNHKINLQKSTTDSEENTKPPVVKEEFKPHLFKKQPKIKPNYETKSGGMLNKNLSTKKKTKQYKNLFDSSQISSRYMQTPRSSFTQKTAAPLPSPRAAHLQRSSLSRPIRTKTQPECQVALPLPLVSIKEQESSHNSRTLNKKSNEQGQNNKSSNDQSL